MGPEPALDEEECAVRPNLNGSLTYLGFRMEDCGGRCLTSRSQQVPASPCQWSTDEPYYVIASQDFGRVTIYLRSTFRL